MGNIINLTDCMLNNIDILSKSISVLIDYKHGEILKSYITNINKNFDTIDIDVRNNKNQKYSTTIAYIHKDRKILNILINHKYEISLNEIEDDMKFKIREKNIHTILN